MNVSGAEEYPGGAASLQVEDVFFGSEIICSQS
jgi:hypothetical protein